LSTATKPRKKVAAKRHQRVAEEFQKWLIKNPKAPKKRKVSTFDSFCDSAVLDEEIKEIHNA
jgi:hypothetical protein